MYLYLLKCICICKKSFVLSYMVLFLHKCIFICQNIFAFAKMYFYLKKMYLYLHECIYICIFKNVFVFAQMYVCLPASAWGRLFPKQRSCPSSPFDVIIVNILYKHYIINDQLIIHDTSDIFKSDNLRQAWKKGRPDYRSSLISPKSTQKMQKRDSCVCVFTLYLHALLRVIVLNSKSNF